MEVLVLIVAAALLFGLLVWVFQAVQFFTTTHAWMCLVLIGLWVAGNIFGILWVESLDTQYPLLASLGRVWAGMMFYTWPVQAVVFTVAFYWSTQLMLRDDVSAPATRVEFVTDFVRGSTIVAAVIFLGFTLNALAAGTSGQRILGLLYAIVALTVTVAPWVPAMQLEERVQARPGRVFWVCIVAYALLSAAGMALYDADLNASAQPPLDLSGTGVG